MVVKDSKAKDSKKDHPDLRFFNLEHSDLEHPNLEHSELRQSSLSAPDSPAPDLPVPGSPAPGANHFVEFTPTKTDQDLLNAIEVTLNTGTHSSFSELCKQALQQLLLSPQVKPTEGQASLQLITLQQQVMDLQRQVGKLEGVLEGTVGMQRLMSLQQLEQKLEHQLMQLDQRIVHHTADLTHRIDRLEPNGIATGITHGIAVPSHPYVELDNLGADLSSDLSLPEPDPIDPLLSRLVPLLEDF